jgi:hypothetical protein
LVALKRSRGGEFRQPPQDVLLADVVEKAVISDANATGRNTIFGPVVGGELTRLPAKVP